MTNMAPETPVKDPQPPRDGMRHVGWTWTIPTRTGEVLRVYSHSPHVDYESTPIYGDVPQPVADTQEALL